MISERLMKVLVSPIISEKSDRVADSHRQIVFRVLPDSSKPEIKQAVEKLFEVKVMSVTVSNVQGKKKRLGSRSDWRKAYVTLQPGYNIDFAMAD